MLVKIKTCWLSRRFAGVKKDHDWVVEELTDLFRTTHHTKTEHVAKTRGRHCGDIILTSYLRNEVDTVTLVLDLRIDHDRFGSRSFTYTTRMI
jgi:hypothetical protein